MIKLLLTIGDVANGEFARTPPRVSIGRNVDSDIVLDDPLVSDRHALIIGRCIFRVHDDGNRSPTVSQN